MEEVKFLRCKKCGTTIAFIVGDGDNVQCCGEEMSLLHPKDADGAKEKHLPKVSRHEGAVRVDVGEISHPMGSEHFIEWIYLQTKRGGQFVRLNPDEEPRATFGVSAEEPADEPIAVYSYCNNHGLWKVEV